MSVCWGHLSEHGKGSGCSRDHERLARNHEFSKEKSFTNGKSVLRNQWDVSRASESEKLRTRLSVKLHILGQQTGHITEGEEQESKEESRLWPWCAGHHPSAPGEGRPRSIRIGCTFQGSPGTKPGRDNTGTCKGEIYRCWAEQPFPPPLLNEAVYK